MRRRASRRTIQDERPPARLRAHYEIERVLAVRLRSADADARTILYRTVYDELFRRVPDHPQLVRKAAAGAADDDETVRYQLLSLRRFIRSGSRFLELGAGDCRLVFAVAARVRSVVAVDVCEQIARRSDQSLNFELVLTDGREVPVAPESVDVAYSNQLLEHLHPDDAAEHASGVLRALTPGGVYVCITPNRLTGPHDISGGFDDVPRGLHLREYTFGELGELLRRAGFARVQVLVTLKRRALVLPLGPLSGLERILERLPARARAALIGRVGLWKLLGPRALGGTGTAIVATKP